MERREPLENQGPVDFSVTIRLVSLPGFYWTYDLCHPSASYRTLWSGSGVALRRIRKLRSGRWAERSSRSREWPAGREPSPMTCESAQQRRLDGNQQVVRQDTQKDMRFHPVLEVMRVIRCRFIFSGRNDELPSWEGAPGGLDRASGFPFPLENSVRWVFPSTAPHRTVNGDLRRRPEA